MGAMAPFSGSAKSHDLIRGRLRLIRDWECVDLTPSMKAGD